MPTIKANVAIKDGGPKTHTGNGRKLQQGQILTVTGMGDILYYMSTGLHDVTVISGKLPGHKTAKLTEEPEAEEPVEEEPEAEEPVEEEPEAEEDDEDLAEEEPEAEEPSDDMAEEPNEADDANLADGDGTAGKTAALAPYVRSELELMSKRKLIEKAMADGLEITLRDNMTKVAIVDAMMDANPKRG